MKEIFSSPEVIASITSCIVAFFSMLTAVFTVIKQRQSVAKATAYLEAENSKLKSQVLSRYFDASDAKKGDIDEKTVR